MQPYKAMMSDAEVRIIESILTPTSVCLEWGSGFSTLYFPDFVNSWTSIEHDPAWFSKVNFDLPDNAQLIFAPTQAEYLDIHNFYDFILIDGLYREECLDIALHHVTNTGKILLHDADRLEYAGWVNKYPYKKLIGGEMVDPYDSKYFLIRGLYNYGH